MELKKITLKNIADQIGITQGTVSRALRGDPLIKLATRRTIAKAAMELGYRRGVSNDNQYSDNDKLSSLANHLKAPNKNATIYDIAKKLNISSATVSRALNPMYKANKNTRQKILAAAIELGYSVNYTARNLRAKDKTTLSEGNIVTIYTIAKTLGLSAATVSRSFNKSSKTSTKTRALVLQLAAELGFVPNEQASQLRKHRKQKVAVIKQGLLISTMPSNIHV